MKNRARVTTASLAVLATLGLSIPNQAVAVPDSSPTVAASARAVTADAKVVRHANRSYTVTWEGAGRHRVYASTKPRNPSKSGQKVGASAWGSLHVKGLDPNARWYFEIVSPRAVKAATVTKKVKRGKKVRLIKRTRDVQGLIVATERVALDSTSNTRDMGGLRTVDGRTIRWGMLFRSDAVTAPTARDAELLARLRLRHAVDFRAESEVSKSGANQFAASVRDHAVPLLDASTDALSVAIQRALQTGDPEVVEELLGDGKAERIARDGIADLILSEGGRTGFGKVLRLLARPDGAPMIFNCTAGKDRTGAFAAIVERLLGVSERKVLAGYEASNVYRATHNQATYDRLAGAGVNIELLRPLLEQDGANLAAAFRAIDERYGSFDRFLKRGLGLDAKTIEKIRANLLA